MGIKIVTRIEQEFNEEARQWEAEVTPTLLQTFEGYYSCPEHGTLHEDDLPEDQPPMDDDASARCPHCNAVVDPKEETRIELGTTLYEAPSVCEVNSAIETNLLVLQRRCEEEGENLRQAEVDRHADKEAAEEREDRELDELGLSEDRHGGLIDQKAHERLAKRKEERDAKPEPEAG